MDIKVTTKNGRLPITVIEVSGNIDSSTYEAFQSRINEIVKDGATHMLVDLSKVPFMSSAGLRVLHDAYNQLRSKDPKKLSEDEIRQAMSSGGYKSPHLKLLSPSKETRTTLEMGGFDVYIEVYDDLQKAIASF